MADVKTAEKTRVKKPRSRARRILRALGWMVVIVLCLVVLGPTLVTILPTESLVQSQANKILRGRLEISGLKVGWVSPLRIGKVALYETKKPDAMPIFYMANLSIEKGLFGNIFAEDKLGEVRLDTLAADIRRDANGTINFMEALPPPAPDQEAAAAKEPFELSVRKYLPAMKIPTSALDAKVDTIHVSYRDDAITTESINVVFDGKAAARWRGGRDDLNASLQGAASTGKKVVPLLALLQLKNWTDGKKLTLDQMTAGANFYPAVDDREPALASAKVSISGSETQAILSLNASRLPPLMQVLPENLNLPRASGIMTATLSLNEGDPTHTQVSAVVQNSPIVLQEYSRAGGDWTFPETALTVGATLDSKTLQRSKVAATYSADFASLNAEEVRGDAGVSTVDLHGTADFGAMTALVTTLKIAPAIVPTLDGTLEAQAHAVYTDTAPRGGTATITWNGRRIAWPTKPQLPGMEMLCDTSIDLQPTSFVISASAAPRADGSVDMDVDAASPLLQAHSRTHFVSTQDLETWLSFDSRLGDLYDYADNEVAMPVALVLTGNARGEINARVTGKRVRQSGTLTVSEFSVASDLIPSGSITDEIAMDWSANTDLAALNATRALAGIESNFGTLAAGVRYDPQHGNAISADGSLNLAPVLALLPPGTMPAPEMMTLSGTVVAGLDVASTSTEHYDVSVGVRTADDFELGIMGGAAALRSLSMETSATLDMEANGDKNVNFSNFSAHVGDFLNATADGSVEMTAATQRIAVNPVSTLDLGKLGAFISPLLEARQLGQLTMAGELTQTLALKGTLITGSQPLAFAEPLEISSETSLPIVEVTYATEALTTTVGAEELGLKFSMNAPSTDDITVKVDDASLGFLSLAVPQATVELPTVHASGELQMSPSSRVFKISKATIDAPGALSAKLDATVDLNKRVHSLVSEFEASDLSRFVVRMADTPTDALPLLSGSAKGNFSVSADLNHPAPRGSPVSFAYAVDGRAEWNDLAMHYGEYAATGLTGRVTLNSSPEETKFRGQADLAEVTSSAAAAPLARNIGGRAFVYYDSMGTFYLRNLEIDSKDTATNLYLRGKMESIPTLIETIPAEKTPKTLSAWLMSVPFDVYAGAKQDLTRVPMTTDAVEIMSGIGDLSMRLHSDPGERLEVSVGSEVENLDVSMPGLVQVIGMNGSLPITRSLSYSGAPVTEISPEQGRITITKINVTHPRLNGVMENTVLTAGAESRRATVSMLCEDFFGGPAAADLRLSSEGGDPAISMDFIATGLDGACYMPALSRRPLASRTANCYGSLRLTLAEGQQVNGLLDRLTMRMEFTEVGPEILRETLRAMDAGGSNPGIQATLASLRFSRPVRLAVEMRGGLMNLMIDMTTPTGIVYTIPVFERTSVTSLLEGRIDPAMGERLAMTRTAAVLLLAQRFDDLMTMVNTQGAKQ